MNIDNHQMNLQAKSPAYFLNLEPELQDCSLVNSSWQDRSIDVTAHRLNALARDVYQELALPYRPNRELFEARLSKTLEPRVLLKLEQMTERSKTYFYPILKSSLLKSWLRRLS